MLLVNEIYPAVCGESRFSGTPCTLVRLTGCHLRCRWCDSAHSFGGGSEMSVPEILSEVRRHGFGLVLVTGGEPLLQRQVGPLLSALMDDGRTVLLETSGAVGSDKLLPLAEVPSGVHRVVDIKAPGSGIDGSVIDWNGIASLGPDDEIKIVIADRVDFEWARDLIRGQQRLPAGVRVALSAAVPFLEPSLLAEWILADGLDAVFQIQLHKALWPDRERGT